MWNGINAYKVLFRKHGGKRAVADLGTDEKIILYE
jgi:hypothetical protein